MEYHAGHSAMRRRHRGGFLHSGPIDHRTDPRSRAIGQVFDCTGDDEKGERSVQARYWASANCKQGQKCGAKGYARHKIRHEGELIKYPRKLGSSHSDHRIPNQHPEHAADQRRQDAKFQAIAQSTQYLGISQYARLSGRSPINYPEGQLLVKGHPRQL